jgi:phosphate transport system protein
MDRFFHQELETLRSHLVLMAEKAIAIVRTSFRALEESDFKLAEEAREQDDAIDELEKVIDAEAIRYITLRAPVASDLRLITVAIKASHDLERVGDEATNVAKRVKQVLRLGALPTLRNLPSMMEIVLSMLYDAMEAFLRQDAELALDICARDEEVDRLNRENFVGYSQDIAEQKVFSVQFIEMIFISKAIERIADHATNIAEEVYFLQKGKDIRHTLKAKKQPT